MKGQARQAGKIIFLTQQGYLERLSNSWVSDVQTLTANYYGFDFF